MIVDWTLPAIEDLDSIQEFIATDRESLDDAYSFIYELLSLGDSLCDDSTAKRGTPAPWINDDNIRELYYKGYTLVYEIDGNTVHIHEVYNQKRVHLRYAKRRYP